MEEVISSLFSTLNFNSLHSAGGGIMLALFAIGSIAILSYLIFKVAILGLKFAAVGAGLYFLSTILGIVSSDDVSAKHNKQPIGMNSRQDHDLSQLKNDIRDLLENSKSKVLPLLTGIQNARNS